MMNDTQFIEAARHLATNSLKTASQNKERISNPNHTILFQKSYLMRIADFSQSTP